MGITSTVIRSKHTLVRILASLLCVGWILELFLRPSVLSSESWTRVDELDPSIVMELRYATTNNFLQAAVYPEPICLLRDPVARQLVEAQRLLVEQGYRLKVWDCYRPLSVQRQMWVLFPNPTYVANPAYGSRHNRGAAVDVSLVAVDGSELSMPTDFDDFSEQASPYSNQWDPEAREHYQQLNAAMTQAGFVGLASEWWHYDSTSWRQFPVSDQPLKLESAP